MKKILTYTIVLFFLLFSLTSKAGQKNDTSSLFKKLDEYLLSAVKVSKFNGCVLVAQKGKIIIEKGYGWRNFANHTLNDSNTISQIGSLTKPFTAMVILKLQEEAKLSVNDLLSKYFPEQKSADKITVQNLLNHTSGIYDYTRDIPENDSLLLSHPVTKQKILNAFIHHSLENKPGKKYNYCSSDYFLLGVIIEKITGMTYEQAVRKMIFEPLGMAHSGFDFINLKSPSKATGYLIFNADKHSPAIRWDSTVTYSAGGMYSTTGDLYKWAKAIADKRILKTSSWNQALTPNLEHYGYGWWIDKLYGYNYITHSGGLPGFMSNFIYFPDQDVSIILINNFGTYGESLWPINLALSAIIFDKPYSLWENNTTVMLNEALLKQYTGTYSADGKVYIYITIKSNQLYAESTSKNGIPKLPIYAKNSTEFFLKDFNAVFTFTRDAEGNVTSFISFENGKNIAFKKIK